MIKKNKFFLPIFFFVIFTTYSFNEEKQNLNIIFPIKKIEIKNTFALDLVKLKSEFEFFKKYQLIFLKRK